MKLFINSYNSSQGSRRSQPTAIIPIARLSIPIAILIVLIASPLVPASAIPVLARPYAHDMLLRADAIQSGEFITDDLLSVSHRPSSDGHAQEDRWVVKTSPDDEAAKLPILVAPDDTDDTNSALSSSLVARSNTDSLPTPFDTNLSTNFSSESCPKFFNEFLSNTTITDCHAISLLLHDSTSFFHALTSAAATSHILDLACAAPVHHCTEIMSQLATRLLKDDACGRDHKRGNPLVTDAYIAMLTYEPVYRATCLKNPDTMDYCLVDAATNSSSPQNLDVYSLPAGVPLASPYPTCNHCLQASLEIFSRWAQIDGQPLDRSYLPSALAINRHCGENFANVNIAVGRQKSVTSAAPVASVDVPLLRGMLAVCLGVLFLGL